MSTLRIDGILETFNRHDVEYVVIGGIAALAHKDLQDVADLTAGETDRA